MKTQFDFYQLSQNIASKLYFFCQNAVLRIAYLLAKESIFCLIV